MTRMAFSVTSATPRHLWLIVGGGQVARQIQQRLGELTSLKTLADLDYVPGRPTITQSSAGAFTIEYGTSLAFHCLPATDNGKPTKHWNDDLSDVPAVMIERIECDDDLEDTL